MPLMLVAARAGFKWADVEADNQAMPAPRPAALTTPATSSAAVSASGQLTAADGGRRYRRVTVATLGAIVALANFAAPARAGTLSTKVIVRTTSVGVPAQLQYCSNARVEDSNLSVRTVAIVIHGDSRDACSYAAATVAAASANGIAASTLVVAPHFLADSDAHSGRMYWSEAGWKIGDKSHDTGDLSSFSVVDRLLASITTTHYPNLQRVVVAGHSAGGQFVNRYAATSPNENVDRYLVANPSSYLYVSTKRFNGSTLRNLTKSERSACRGYNDYKYGLLDRNAYASDVSDEILRTRLASRPTTLLLGTADTSRSYNLDTSCEADWQGRDRYVRGHLYHDQYLPAEFGPGTVTNNLLSDVPSVGHSWPLMARSAEGRAALFG